MCKSGAWNRFFGLNLNPKIDNRHFYIIVLATHIDIIGDSFLKTADRVNRGITLSQL